MIEEGSIFHGSMNERMNGQNYRGMVTAIGSAIDFTFDPAYIYTCI